MMMEDDEDQASKRKRIREHSTLVDVLFRLRACVANWVL